MHQRIAVAIGAGAAAALLFAVSATTSALAMVLAYLAPLPIMIATLGWGLDAGAIAVGISVAALAVLAEPLSAVAYAASVAAPAWVLAAFAATPLKKYAFLRLSAPATHASVGAIVTLAAALGMLGAVAVLTSLIVIYRGYEHAAEQVSMALAAVAAEALDLGVEATPVKDIVEGLVHWGPAAIAASTLLMLCVNLYGAARSTQLSKNLSRPWPDIPTSLALPWPLGIILVACAAGAFTLHPPLSQYASIGAGGLGGAFALQGLAVAHALSRGLKLRPVMLVALYLCCLLRAKYTLPVLAALGVIDAFTRLRARVALLPNPHPKPQK
jgi:hypothetical protein